MTSNGVRIHDEHARTLENNKNGASGGSSREESDQLHNAQIISDLDLHFFSTSREDSHNRYFYHSKDHLYSRATDIKR